MKELKFTTSKGEFILVDSIGRENYYEALRSEGMQVEHIGMVKDMTEEQFAEFVEMPLPSFEVDEDTGQFSRYDISARESFLSLIRSLGWYLWENPECPNQFCDNGYIGLGYNEKARCSLCEEVEERVFENPILLKKI